jgi:hypothetical protein
MYRSRRRRSSSHPSSSGQGWTRGITYTTPHPSPHPPTQPPPPPKSAGTQMAAAAAVTVSDLPEWVKPPGSGEGTPTAAARKAYFEVLKPGATTKVGRMDGPEGLFGCVGAYYRAPTKLVGSADFCASLSHTDSSSEAPSTSQHMYPRSRPSPSHQHTHDKHKPRP